MEPLSGLTCPHCRHVERLAMPTDAYVFFHECAACHVRLRPKSGDCCVFCSFGVCRQESRTTDRDCCRRRQRRWSEPSRRGGIWWWGSTLEGVRLLEHITAFFLYDHGQGVEPFRSVIEQERSGVGSK